MFRYFSRAFFSEFTSALSVRLGLNLEYFFSGGFWIFLRYLAISLSGFAVTVFFARWSEPEFFGKYQYVLSLLSLFSIGALPGLAFPLMREMSKKNDRAYFKVAKLSLFFGVASSLLFFVFSPYFVENYTSVRHALWYVFFFFPFIYSLGYWYVFFEYRGYFSIVSIALSLQSILLSSVIILQLYLGKHSLESLILSYLIVTLLVNVCMSSFVYRSISREGKGDGNISLSYGVEITAQKGLFILVDVILPFFIPMLFAFEFLAFYQIGSFFAVAFGGLISGLSSLYIPLLFKYEHLNYKRVLLQNFILGIGFLCFYSIIILFVYPFFYGSEYVLSQRIAWIFSLSVLCFPLRIFLQNFFGTRKENGIIIKTYFFSIIFSLFGFILFSYSSFLVALFLQIILFNFSVVGIFLFRYFSITRKLNQ